jgi:probable rRNA maturation factor
MPIEFFTENTQMPIDNQNKVITWIEQFILSKNKSSGDINIIFCTDEYLLEINQKYLNHNSYTDIITFDFCEGNTVSGDIFISLCRVEENAKEFETQDTELLRVIIHGVLHLLGYKDLTDENKKQMRSLEDEAIKQYIEIDS